MAVTVASKTSPRSGDYYRLSDAEIEALRADAKASRQYMENRRNTPEGIASMRPQAREKILSRKPHLRPAVEAILNSTVA